MKAGERSLTATSATAPKYSRRSTVPRTEGMQARSGVMKLVSTLLVLVKEVRRVPKHDVVLNDGVLAEVLIKPVGKRSTLLTVEILAALVSHEPQVDPRFPYGFGQQ